MLRNAVCNYGRGKWQIGEKEGAFVVEIFLKVYFCLNNYK